MFCCAAISKRRLVDSLAHCRPPAADDDDGRRAQSHAVAQALKSLTKADLQLLRDAVVSEGRAEPTRCIIEPCTSTSSSALLDKTPFHSAVELLWHQWRHSDAQGSGRASLRPLPWCRLSAESASADTRCCNPYHYALWQFHTGFDEPDIAAENGRIVVDEGEQSGASSTSGFCSADASQPAAKCGRHEHPPSTKCGQWWRRRLSAATRRPAGSPSPRETAAWCHCAYWQENRRVGRLTAVGGDRAVVCAADDGASSGTAAAAAAEVDRLTLPIADERTRERLGAGFELLRRDDDQVWLYNRCSLPLFVHSNAQRRATCWRVPPDHCALLHRLGAPALRSSTECLRCPPSAQISFGKGWGASYRRPQVSCCPCWVEVIFRR